MPPKPRWLLAIPDAISQLEKLARTLLTRRDIERLFGVSKVRAAALMKTFGAEMTGNLRTLPRTKLLQQLTTKALAPASAEPSVDDERGRRMSTSARVSGGAGRTLGATSLGLGVSRGNSVSTARS